MMHLSLKPEEADALYEAISPTCKIGSPLHRVRAKLATLRAQQAQVDAEAEHLHDRLRIKHAGAPRTALKGGLG